MLAGEFGQGLALPFGILLLLATMIGCGIWTEQLGRQQAMRVPLAYLAGLLVGAVAPVIPQMLPLADIAMPVAVIVLGLLIVASVPASAAVAMAAVFAVGLLVGYGFLGGSRYEPLKWLGLACGTLLATASGIGLTVMVSTGFASGLVRLLGLGIAGLGVWTLIEGM